MLTNGITIRQILLSGLVLWGFAVVGTTIVAFTEQSTEQQIIENERAVLLRNLYALLPPEELDNDIATDIFNYIKPMGKPL